MNYDDFCGGFFHFKKGSSLTWRVGIIVAVRLFPFNLLLLLLAFLP